ncbi:MAG: fused MFS/spermidine synthase, partial [Fimbriiglobus sp.]
MSTGLAGPLSPARLVAVGAAVFAANAGLLVLQLAAGRWLAPFVGSSLETWTAVIGAFLTGIAAGNAVGGKLADRYPSGRRLALALVLGAAAAVWMVAVPRILAATGVHQILPLGVRIPVLAMVLCLPAGFALSLPTPLAVRILLADVRRAGRVTGTVFALGTLGCLAGNYATGFVLIPTMTLDEIGCAVAGALIVMAAGTWMVSREAEPSAFPSPALGSASRLHGEFPVETACRVVFLCSFAAMTLELCATRLMAQILGVSLYTWTGVIGVMLAGTAAGNGLGGAIADRAGPRALAWCLALATAAGVAVLLVFFLGNSRPIHDSDSGLAGLLHRADVVTRVLAWTFALAFPAMLMLGTISPQVIRLAVPDVGHAGRVAGRVYAWSTAGAIAGTFATGFVLISTVGTYRTVLVAALLPAAAAVLAVRRQLTGGVLYTVCLAGGTAAGGLLILDPETVGITRETNYFSVRVRTAAWPRTDRELADSPAVAVAGPAGTVDPPGTVLALQLDRLTHSRVKPDDPGYLFYPHE